MNQRLTILRSVTIVSVSTYIEYAIGFVVSIWIARALGPADFGRYAFTIWLCGWLMVCSNHALTTSSTKFIAEAEGAGSPDIASYISGNLSRFQHVSSFIVALLFVLGTLIFQPPEWQQLLLPVTALMIVAVVAKANYSMLVAIEKGQSHFEPEAIATVLAGLITVLLVIAAAWLHAGLLTFIAIFAVSSLLLNLINRLAFRRYCTPFNAGPIPQDIRRRLHRHLWLTAILVLLGLLRGNTVEMFLLNKFSSSAAVGFFAIAVLLTRGAVQLFSVGLTSTLLPYMAKSFGQRGQDHAARFLAEATRFYWAAGLAIAGLGLVTTPDIVTLMYGDRYVSAIPVIQAILVTAGLLLFGNGIGAFQTVVDRQSDRIRITLGALIANAAIGIALIPHYGLPGAVISYAGGGMTQLGLSVLYLRRASTGALPFTAMLRLFAVAVVATALAWLVTELLPSLYAFIAGSVIFVVVYVPASVLSGYWSREDMQLMSTVGNKLGPLGRALMRGLNALQDLRT